jgi:protease prsW family protein
VSGLVALAGCLSCLYLLRRVRARLGDEPVHAAIWATFALGALSTAIVFAYAPLLAIPLEGPLGPWARGLGDAFLLAAVPEETAKFLVVTAFATAWGCVRGRRSGVAHGLAASLGFAVVEMTVFATRCGPGAVALRVLTTLPCHASVGVLMGWLVGESVSAGSVRPVRFGLALALPVALHGTYDFPLMVLARAGGAASPGTPAFPLLVALGTVVLVGLNVVAIRVYRSVFPHVSRDGVQERAVRALEFAFRRGAVAWALIPLGGAMASVGGWVVGSLLFVRAPSVDAMPAARPVVTALYAVGAALICFGLAFGFRGIRARAALRPALAG